MVKKIGNDSVVVMTLKQGEEINKSFTKLRDSISYLKLKKDSINMDLELYMLQNGRRLQYMYSEWNREYNEHKITRSQLDSFRSMYMANKLIYVEREREMKTNVKHITIFATFLGFLAVLFARY